MSFLEKTEIVLISTKYLLSALIKYQLFGFEDFIQFSKGKIIKKYPINKIKQACSYQIKIADNIRVSSCLIRSVALKRMINSMGWDATIFIGVTNDKKFYSHSWVSTQFQDFFKPGIEMERIRTFS